jgi:hypothetical protein
MQTVLTIQGMEPTEISGRNREYWKGKLNEVLKKRRKDIPYLYRGINEFQKG